MAAAGPVRVLFLLQRPETWTNVSGLWRHMAADADFEPTLLLLPYNHGAPAAPKSNAAFAALLEAEGVPFETWQPDAAPPADGSHDVAVFTVPYDRERPPAFHFDRVAKRVGTTVYIPYGMSVGAGFKNRWYQYAQPAQMHADLVVARSEHERKLYARYCPTGDRHVRALGLPRLDALQSLDRFEVDPALRSAVGDRVAVLWNSHFSFGPSYGVAMSYSTFDRLGASLLRFASDRTDLALIWRPHPRLFDELVANGLCTVAELATLRTELAEAGIVLDERPDHRHAFAVSDALLTDLGSFLIEYLATGKPMLYLHNPDGEGPNEEAAAILAAVGEAEEPWQVEAFMDQVLAGQDPRAELRRMVRASVLPMLDGQASRRVSQYIKGLVRPGQHPRDGSPLRPAMARLEAGLARIVRDKRAVGGRERRWRRTLFAVRSWLLERAKRLPWLLRLLDGRR